ncbi:unnamed protein product [Fusarium venenatum]|uniref:Uncharacterized protein n=1 Tax=Fusarium venenatum TaxID=56646 RepID=A0A2L2TLU3_9HYPO|nr:uncharacterized protein FVRRES_03043 [Fusarium venenatum]CEI66531.1 unnamed protein product [Fusarium venenatum]
MYSKSFKLYHLERKEPRWYMPEKTNVQYEMYAKFLPLRFPTYELTGLDLNGEYGLEATNSRCHVTNNPAGKHFKI